ncbi:MAG: folylpolyglutamate synthase/dihydrofolate synthase family protein [Acidobacteriota bacterium]
MHDPNPESRIPNPGEDPIAYLFGLEFHGHKLGLENIRTLVAALGHPERAFQALHIAGTNGKGSVAAMCAAALAAAGHRTGCYTSPHIVSIEERFAIDGEPVSRRELEAAVEHIRRVAVRLTTDGTLRALPTFFEVATAAAFLLFQWRCVDVAVLEVGLGGRLDATNVVSPCVGTITTIDVDHQRHLGDTLAAIAREKAGIVKPGMIIVSGERKPDAAGEVEAACRERGARLVCAFEGTEVSVGAHLSGRDTGRATIALATPVRTYPPVTLSLRGRHQVDNAIVAVRALEALDACGTHVPESAIREGLACARWAGRLEVVDLGQGRSVLLDAAHNPAGAHALGEYLAECYPNGIVLVFGAVRDKDHRGMLCELLPHATHVVLSAPPTHRAAPTHELVAIARELRPGLPLIESPSPDEALAHALALGPSVCVAGSIYLLGAVTPRLAPLRLE